MADDLDFVWAQTERPAAPGRTVSHPDAGTVEWVTLRDAADRTGIPLSTIRNWARKQRVPTQLANEAAGLRRMVGIEAVLQRARELGRLSPPGGEDRRTESPAPAESAASERTHAGGDHPVPEGHLLVPLDAWEKMLVQLGNLHSAGQELAEARERAARAETEAAFLRERVADLREARDHLLNAEADAPVPDRQPDSTVDPWYRRLADRMKIRR